MLNKYLGTSNIVSCCTHTYTGYRSAITCLNQTRKNPQAQMRIAYLTVPTTSSKVRKSIFPYLLWHLEPAEPGRGKLWWIWKQWNPKATFSFSTLGTTLASPWLGSHKCAQNPGRPLLIWKWCPFYNPKCARSALNSHRWRVFCLAGPPSILLSLRPAFRLKGFGL